MTDLATVIRATRASASALDRMARHAREAADCCAVIARNHARVAARQLTAESAEIGNRFVIARRNVAMPAWQRASRAFNRAQAILAANPLPGERPFECIAERAPTGTGKE